MKEGLGFTVDINIAIIFITVIFAFMSAVIVFFKTSKINDIIINSIEKFEGYNSLAVEEINNKIASLGYQTRTIGCVSTSTLRDDNCDDLIHDGENGYCVYSCKEKINGKYYYYYKIRTSLIFNVPFLDRLIDIKSYSNTAKMYDFERNRVP